MKSLSKPINFIVVIFAVLMSAPSYAALIDNGDGTISDSHAEYSDIMWMKDANYAATTGYSVSGAMTWLDATTFVDLVNSGTYANFGYTDWRLATAYNLDGTTICDSGISGANCTETEMGHLYFAESFFGSDLGDSFDNYVYFGTSLYWTGTDAIGDSGRAMTQDFIDGGQNDISKSNSAYAMLVRDTTESVPEASSIYLLAFGLLSLFGAARRKI